MSDGKKPKFKNPPRPQGQDKVKIDQVFEVDTRFGIMMAIDNFGSLNIKKLAKILGKNEATIHHHVKWLTQEPRLLDIDQQKTLKTKGIFYTFSSKAREFRHILGLTPNTEERNQPEERKGTEKLGDLLELSPEELSDVHMRLISHLGVDEKDLVKERRLMSYNHILEDIFLQNLEQAVKAVREGKKPKNHLYPIGALSNFSIDMKVSNIKHLYRVLHLLTKLVEEFQELRDDIAKEIENVPEENLIDLHYHIVGGEIAEFEFE